MLIRAEALTKIISEERSLDQAESEEEVNGAQNTTGGAIATLACCPFL